MQIKQSIIHGIVKQKDSQGPESINIKLRKNLLPVDERLITLCDEILKLYTKLSNGYGILGTELDLHRFPKYLTDHINGQCDFSEFSNKSIAVIAESMSQQIFATTSYPIFFHYTKQGRNWLLITVLKLKEGVGIDEKTLDLNDSLFFDISNLREAARIDIEKWKNNQQPYLSFIKRGTGSDAESSRYFRDALSCLEYTDAKHNTEVALKAIDEYCDYHNYGAEKKQEVRSKMFEYCKAKKNLMNP